MSSSPHTASNQAPAEPRRGGIELSTLVVAGLAAVIAAYVVSKIWAPGTMWATAFTPVIVSLVKEALERPAKRVSAVATRAASPRPLARATRTVVQPPPEADAPPPPMTLDPELTERRVYGTRAGGIQRRWKIAVITGLLAFVGVVALFTLPELVAGRSVTSGGSDTTFFGGRRTRSSTTKTQTQTTTTVTKTTTTPAQTTPTTTTTTPAQTTPTTTTTTPAQTAPTTTTPPPAAAPPAQTTPTTPAAP